MNTASKSFIAKNFPIEQMLFHETWDYYTCYKCNSGERKSSSFWIGNLFFISKKLVGIFSAKDRICNILIGMECISKTHFTSALNIWTTLLMKTFLLNRQHMMNNICCINNELKFVYFHLPRINFLISLSLYNVL